MLTNSPKEEKLLDVSSTLFTSWKEKIYLENSNIEVLRDLKDSECIDKAGGMGWF